MNDPRTYLNPLQKRSTLPIQYLHTAPDDPSSGLHHKYTPPTNRPLSRRVVPTNSPILIQENDFHPKFLIQAFKNEQKPGQPTQKNSKNYRDVKKSLEKLARVPGNSGSGDEILGQSPRWKPERTTVDLTLENLQIRQFPGTDGKVTPRNKEAHKPPLFREIRSERDDKYLLGSSKRNGQKNMSHQYQVELNPGLRNLRTEGDVGVGPRLKMDSGGKVMGRGRMNENPGTIALNNISDDVKYGEGGVGYSAGGKRRKVQEGEPLVWDGERKGREDNKSRQSSGDRKVICVGKQTMDRWKHDISEIKRDIASRKKSYERVERFIAVQEVEGRKPSPVFIPALPHTMVSSQATGPTLTTIPTQPAQPALERFVSPSFASAKNFPLSVQTPLFGALQNSGQNNDRLDQRSSRLHSAWEEYDIDGHSSRSQTDRRRAEHVPSMSRNIELENERENEICKVACCGKGSGCQIF